MILTADGLIPYIETYHEYKRNFPWDGQLMKQFGAMMFYTAKSSASVETVKAMRTHIKKQASAFSNFRGINELLLATLLATDADGEARFERMQAIYKDLKSAKFQGGTYLPMVTFILSGISKDHSMEPYITRMQGFYKGMKDNHFFLTGQDDYVYAALFALSDLPIDPTTEKMTSTYEALIMLGFKKGNGLQSLVHLLTLGSMTDSGTLEQVVTMHQTLKQTGYRMQDAYMPTIGIFALLGTEADALLNTSIKASEWLMAQRGFGRFSLDKKMRFLLASSLVLNEALSLMAKDVHQTVLTNTLQGILIAQQAATMATIAAVSASTAASSGH